ncbi:MAG: PQQ-like beta-propeller repeat protein [Planctomycetota bacterium]|nr:PQQ-like beta-propeller repeat protein [Planctomycetota bacterium]
MKPIHIRRSPRLAILLLALVGHSEARASQLDDSSDTWPQWRGPNRDGTAPGEGWGADLSDENFGVKWEVNGLGPSYSGPVVDANRVYITETVDKTTEVVRALNRFSGEELWKTSWVGAMKVPFFASRNGSWIRSTPAVDEASIYVAGMRDVLTCLHAETGKVRWSVDFKERFKTSLPAFGCPSSPLLTKTHVYVQAGAGLVKLDKETGATIWRTTLDSGDSMSGGAFSSPVMATLGGIPQLVVQSRTELAGISIDDGAILWSTAVKAFRGMNILTPTIFGEAVFTSAYGGRAHLFQVDGNEGGLDIRVGWEASTQGYMTSPVVLDGTAYLFLKSNRFGCLDLETGAKGWTSPPTGDSYWSLAIQGNRILSLSDSGVLRLIGAEPGGYRVISEREISEEETWAHIAPAGKQVFVRSQQSLIALNWL